ncbi:MAG: APC family permease, partial [Nocardia sp.]|nr:APC family permease [Nocardia sp.]
TFMVTFAVMSSGITSAATAAKAFAANFAEAFEFDGNGLLLTVIALAFMAAVAAINLRGVGESVKANVLLTCVELSGLLIVVCIGLWALGFGNGDFGRIVEFDTGDRSALGGVIAATTLAFFAMVGFEDSVNMAEETKAPSKIFPKILISGLLITGAIYVMVSVTAVALVPPEELAQGDAPLLRVVEIGAPGFPTQIFAFITMFAVANSALINMLMASRLLYGMAKHKVIPRVLGRVNRARRTPHIAILFTTVLAFGLLTFVDEVPELGGTTALLLLVVFTIVNIAVLVLRRDTVEHEHFRTPTALPVLGALCCAYLATPFTDRNPQQYAIAGVLLVVGVVLWAFTALWNRQHNVRSVGPEIDIE